MSASVGSCLGMIAVALTLGIATSSTWAMQARSAEAQAREEIGAQIEEFGTTLKAAAMSGTLSGEEAREIYGRVVRAAKAAYVRDFGDGKGDGDVAPTPNRNVARLMAPRPERIEVLLRAEFLRRDVTLVRDELDLDGDQTTIAVLLFEDYTEAFDLASAPLREAIVQYRGATINAYIAFALEDAGVRLDAAVENSRRADRAEAMARMEQTLARIDDEKAEDLARASDEEREHHDAWKVRMIAATSDLDERLAAIRARTTAQLSEMGRDGAAITGDDLVRMAQQLRRDRVQLRADLTHSIESIAMPAQRGDGNARFAASMARIRIGQLLPRGRLGGDAMNLWAAWTEASPDTEVRGGDLAPRPRVDALLELRAPAVAAALDARTDATIAREVAGLEYRAVRDRIAEADGASIFQFDERRLASVARPYAEALRREVAASVTVRDALRALLDDVVALLEETTPGTELAARFHAASLRRGFPVETRGRWAERALAAALRLDDLDRDMREALVVIEGDVATELRALRRGAIEGRIRRDPKLAIDFIRSEFEEAEIEFADDLWRELDYAAFAAVDERTDRQLREILRPEQLGALPPRTRKGDLGGKGTGKSETTSGGK